MSTRIEDIVEEGTRVVALAEERGVPLRLVGGVAVRLRCPDAAQRPELARTYKDIDFAAPRRTAKAVRELLAAQGYAPNSHFNALHGASRLLFYDEEHGSRGDGFLDTFENCHTLNLQQCVSLPCHA